MYHHSITELLIQFESCCSEKKDLDQESEVMIMANRLANAVNIDSQLITAAVNLDAGSESTWNNDLNSRILEVTDTKVPNEEVSESWAAWIRNPSAFFSIPIALFAHIPEDQGLNTSCTRS